MDRSREASRSNQNAPSPSTAPPPSTQTFSSVAHAAQSSQPTSGSLSFAQRAPLSSPA